MCAALLLKVSKNEQEWEGDDEDTEKSKVCEERHFLLNLELLSLFFHLALESFRARKPHDMTTSLK